MTLTPHEKFQKLLKPVDFIDRIYIRPNVEDKISYPLMLLKDVEMESMWGKGPPPDGIPRYASTVSGTGLLVYPAPDKGYEVSVVGFITVEQ